MIILYLIALVFILIFLLVNKKEFFTNQCSYLPWGPTYDFCVSNCMSKGKPTYPRPIIPTVSF